jgi:formate hydrogenlyase subunit 3/multisubunit Na+/H+ antiporter MnhD subunit
MVNELLYTITIPLLTGVLLFIIPDRIRFIKELISLVVILVLTVYSIVLYTSGERVIDLQDVFTGGISIFGMHLPAENFKVFFRVDNMSKLIVLFLGIFGFLILLYCFIYNKERIKNFYSFYLITLGASFGVVMSDNLLFFIILWGLLGITLYKLIPGVDENSSYAAKKTLIIVGASDGIMILGIAILWKITGTLSMTEIRLTTQGPLIILAFLTLITGSFAKAGAFPFHSWVPDYTQYSPASSSAFMPASLDKLLGIYFLARITVDLFVLTDVMRLVLLSLGVITIITAVLMALVQHNYKRLLGFHAVSQVGYMIVGFSLGTMIGVAAGLFHMLNNVIYKCGLFLASGNVEFRTGKEDIDELGGLSRFMPLTFIGALIFALSISGVPPLNGFASKWMIYQAIIDFGTGEGISNRLWMIWLGLTVLGSSLTLASFVKFIGGIFLSRQAADYSRLKETPVLMWMPLLILALLCLGFGIFAREIIVPLLLMPVSGTFTFTGFWDSSFISALVLVSILVGVLMYMISGVHHFRTEDSFIGGEKMNEKTGYPVSGFYHTIQEFKLLSWFYKKAEKQWFDLYELFKWLTLWFNKLLSEAHTGILPEYVLWVLAGLVIMLLIMT